MAIQGLRATEQEQARFFTQLREGFAAASAGSGEVVRDFRVAGTCVRLRFAGEAMIPAIVPGLAYPILEPNALETPRCEICLWDSESTAIAPPPPPRPRIDFTTRGNIWGFDSARYRSAYQWGDGSIHVMDRETRLAVFWAPSYRHLPAWVMASPLRNILHWWMELNGRQLVHAAAIGHGGRGVLMPGRGGSGKSSTSLACLLGGMDFVSDDYLALALEPDPRVYRLYATAKLDPQSLSLYPELTKRCRAIHQPGFDKSVLFLDDGYREQMRESLPLSLVLKPNIAGVPETTLGPSLPIDIERALEAETLLHLAHAGPGTVKLLERVSCEIPGAALHLGTDRARIPQAIQAALDGQFDLRSLPCGEQKPFVSVIIHLSRKTDAEELAALAAEMESYPRTELIATFEGEARACIDVVPELLGNVRTLPFDQPVLIAQAWNRGIRESFAELLILLNPGDRLQPGALDALVSASRLEPGSAWVRGAVAGEGAEREAPLSGALIRKSAFRECGLFDTDPFFQNREHRNWLNRAQEKGLNGAQIETVVVHAGSAASFRPPRQVDLAFLRDRLHRRRREMLE